MCMFLRSKQRLRKKNLRGFSVGEVLLGSFILAMGLTATTALIAGSLRHSLQAQDVIVAAELAQEGVELVRNVRDNDFAEGGNGFNPFSNGRRHCRRDYVEAVGSALNCQGGQGSASRYYLEYRSGFGGPAGYYQHSNTRGRFSRYIYVDYNQSGGEHTALVRSFVYWGGAPVPPSDGSTASCISVNRCVFAELVLTNWKP